jgi:hypothetical protein
MIARIQTLFELGALFWANKRWWLVPMVGLLALTALALMVLHAAQYVAPFVYTVF